MTTMPEIESRELTAQFELHEHCESCIKIGRCTVLPAPGRCCLIVPCRQDCGARFHACKRYEHDLLCPNWQAHCLNAEYGCPEIMKRCLLAKHLSKCPASVIHCPTEWIRGNVSSHSQFSHVEENNEILDISFLLRDQRQREKYLRIVANGGFIVHRLMPQRTNSYPYSTPEQISEGNQNNLACIEELEEDLTLKSLALEELKTMSEQPTKVVLDMNISCVKEAKYYYPTRSFVCSQVVRRDEFAWHSKNMHSDVLGNMGGWLEERCPLFEYGCQFSLRRLYPMPKGSTVIYNRDRECLGLRLAPHPANTICEINNAQDKEEFQKAQILLTELPYEILHQIGTYLDGFSLHNLSQTCNVMNIVCNSLLKEKGLVLFSWTKTIIDGRVSWQKANTYWRFSTSFTPIKQWYFGNEQHISNHLKDCPYMDRNTHNYGAPLLGDLIIRSDPEKVLQPVEKPSKLDANGCNQM